MKKQKRPVKSPIPTRSRILQRDWVHAATDDINREIVNLRTMQQQAEEDVTKLRGKASERQKVASQSKHDADALETLLETRK